MSTHNKSGARFETENKDLEFDDFTGARGGKLSEQAEQWLEIIHEFGRSNAQFPTIYDKKRALNSPQVDDGEPVRKAAKGPWEDECCPVRVQEPPPDAWAIVFPISEESHTQVDCVTREIVGIDTAVHDLKLKPGQACRAFKNGANLYFICVHNPYVSRKEAIRDMELAGIDWRFSGRA